MPSKENDIQVTKKDWRANRSANSKRKHGLSTKPEKVVVAEPVDEHPQEHGYGHGV